MLSRFYAATLGIKPYLSELGRIAGRIGNRFPHINVLEIGSSLLILPIKSSPDNI
jgi:hybrid polyketide synthase/nonribosomal peptide synthetase ACE1